jgi:hypothetical protein
VKIKLAAEETSKVPGRRGVLLPREIIAWLVAELNAHGVPAIAKRFGMSPNALTRAAAGLPILHGNAFIIQTHFGGGR